MSQTIFFITGASGFIGRHLCQRLIADGSRVLALVHHHGADRLAAIGAEVVHGSLDHPEDFASRIGDATHVVHLAGDPRFGNGNHYFAINTTATRRLAEAVRDACPNLARFILVSTIGAVDRAGGDSCVAPLNEATPPTPSSDYGRSKLAAEKEIARSGLPFAVVRPAIVVGPDMRADSHVAVLSRAALTRSILARVDWPGAWSVIHVDDLTSAIIAAATHNNAAGRVFFAAGTSFRIGDIFKVARPDSWRLPVGWAVALLRPLCARLPFSMKALLLPALVANDGELRSLGWTPVHDTADAVAEVVMRERTRTDASRPVAGWTLVTGAASGLGHAFARLLARH